MEKLSHYYLNVSVMLKYAPAMLEGFLLTITLAALIVVFGLLVGAALAFVRTFQLPGVNWLIVFIVDFLRAVPQLVIIVLIYFALPYSGLRLSSFWSTVVGLSLVLAAFTEEILWASITSISRGQWEAARSTGLSFAQTLGLVILPQSIRQSIPQLTNRTIAITKATSLGSVIAAQELLSVMTSAQSQAASPSPLTLGVILYLLLFLPFIRITRRLETIAARGMR